MAESLLKTIERVRAQAPAASSSRVVDSLLADSMRSMSVNKVRGNTFIDSDDEDESSVSVGAMLANSGILATAGSDAGTKVDVDADADADVVKPASAKVKAKAKTVTKAKAKVDACDVDKGSKKKSVASEAHDAAFSFDLDKVTVADAPALARHFTKLANEMISQHSDASFTDTQDVVHASSSSSSWKRTAAASAADASEHEFAQPLDNDDADTVERLVRSTANFMLEYNDATGVVVPSAAPVTLTTSVAANLFSTKAPAPKPSSQTARAESLKVFFKHDAKRSAYNVRVSSSRLSHTQTEPVNLAYYKPGEEISVSRAGEKALGWTAEQTTALFERLSDVLPAAKSSESDN